MRRSETYVEWGGRAPVRRKDAVLQRSLHIFNKPYAEEEYWKRVDELKCAMLDRGEYGRFFPADFSMVGYQYSMGELYVGYAPSELALFGAPAFDPTKGNVNTGTETFPSSELPDHLNDLVAEQHVGRPILDSALGRSYTMTPSELGFYQLHGLPLPREHFLTRITNLFRHANGPIPEKVSCDKCDKQIVTWKNVIFSGKRRVLCRPCYLQFIESR